MGSWCRSWCPCGVCGVPMGSPWDTRGCGPWGCPAAGAHYTTPVMPRQRDGGGGVLSATPMALCPPVPIPDTARCRRVPDEAPPPSKQVKPLFRHFRRIDACLQTRVAFRGSDESECGATAVPPHSPAGGPDHSDPITPPGVLACSAAPPRICVSIRSLLPCLHAGPFVRHHPQPPLGLRAGHPRLRHREAAVLGGAERPR